MKQYRDLFKLYLLIWLAAVMIPAALVLLSGTGIAEFRQTFRAVMRQVEVWKNRAGAMLSEEIRAVNPLDGNEAEKPAGKEGGAGAVEEALPAEELSNHAASFSQAAPFQRP